MVENVQQFDFIVKNKTFTIFGTRNECWDLVTARGPKLLTFSRFQLDSNQI